MKKWIITGVALLVTGTVICTAAFAAFGFDWNKLNTTEMETNTYDVSGRFDSIRIDGDTEDISFIPAEDGKCKVVCVEEKGKPHRVNVENKTLTVSTPKERRLNWHFGLSVEESTIKVYLPENEYEKLEINSDTGDLEIPADFTFDSVNAVIDTGDINCFASANEMISIKTDTGDISVSDVAASDMELTTDTGDMKISGTELTGSMRISCGSGDAKISGVSCTDFTGVSDTGDIKMTGVIASGKFNLRADTGDIVFDGCDADEITVETDTGDITGNLLSDKIFFTKTDTGSVDVPKSTTGGKCDLTTDTGDIRLSVQ